MKHACLPSSDPIAHCPHCGPRYRPHAAPTTGYVVSVSGPYSYQIHGKRYVSALDVAHWQRVAARLARATGRDVHVVAYEEHGSVSCAGACWRYMSCNSEDCAVEHGGES